MRFQNQDLKRKLISENAEDMKRFHLANVGPGSFLIPISTAPILTVPSAPKNDKKTQPQEPWQVARQLFEHSVEQFVQQWPT